MAIHDGELLMIRRGHGPAAGSWSVPGGRVEFGEMLAEAVVREMLEETGLECVCGPFIGYVERFGDEPAPYHYVIMDFAVTVLDPEQPPVAGDDAAEAMWVPFEDVSDLHLVTGLYEFLSDHDILDR